MTTVDLLKKLRAASIVSMLALAAATPACMTEDDDAVTADDEVGFSTDDITQVDHSKVKRQSIGNCWLYATVSWYEALNKASTGVEANTSESWLTYWHWFEQIANGRAADEISTGGSYGTAADLINRYGLMKEVDFIPQEGEAEMSARQSSALAAMNLSLKEGVLKEPTARRDRAIVRAELDKAWKLDPNVVRGLNAVFGRSVQRTLDRSFASRKPGYKVIRARDFEVKLKDPTSSQLVKTNLQEAIGTSAGWWSPRQGTFAWNEVQYPSNVSARRAFWKRVQNALHDGMPVVTSWKVDFNALSTASRFSMAELTRRGAGRQGGHMTVMHDYQAQVPGVGLLEAGKAATADQMKAALADGTKIEFIRVKNSWGGIRPDRWSQAALPGYHDLEMAYLDGPIKECALKADGESDPTNCTRDVTPLWDVVLPAGY